MEPKTTLGAPLSPEEYEAMQLSLINTKEWIENVSHNQPPEKFLEIANNLISAGFNLRAVVQKGFNDANRRTLMLRARQPVGGARVALSKPSLQIDVLESDILAALDIVQGKEK